jgi:ATP dependent DNA ligase domain
MVQLGMSLLPPGFVEPCLPTVSRIVPTGPQWAFEIKHDGFRFICLSDGKRVRAFTRGGHDWSGQLPAVTEAMRALSARSVTLDGEVVICGPDGRADFDRMRAQCSAGTARLTPSSTRSISWSLMAAIYEANRGTCAGRRWRGCYATAGQVSGYASISRTRMGRSFSARPATWGLRASSPSGATAVTTQDARATGFKIKNMAHPAMERAMLIALSQRIVARRKSHPARSP